MNNFSPESKVWIYQSNRAFTEAENKLILEKATSFISEWTAHGKLLKASINSYYNRFLVLMVDETQADASGCGIDKSVRFFQQVENEFQINLMNRLLVAYKVNSDVLTCQLSEFEKKIEQGEVHHDTIVFNNLVGTKAEFDNNWEIPLKKSWHSKLLV
ncbi:MAG: ABC transporter ATPase [Bacteroidetes bacterium]|nr:ABC transporter ATPase [Bacteroidota bacterium]MBK9799672.1 ABC transporter ATPase [Bacteroidota bacterium]MBP6413269.1 ABC transporter ATPase [Bacteroidia bacterium]